MYSRARTRKRRSKQNSLRPGFKKDLAKVRGGLVFATLLLAVVQCLMDASYENVTATAFAAGAFVFACQLTFRSVNRGNGTPLTATIVFMAIAANSAAPMLGTALEGHSIVHTLQKPVETYAHRFVVAVVMLAASFIAARVGLLRRPLGLLMDAIRVRQLLSRKQIWILAAFGYVALVLRMLLGTIPPNAVQKFLEGLNFLPFMLFVLLAPPYFKKTIRNPVHLVIVAIGWAAYAGIGVTSRMALVAPVAVVGFGWMVAFLAGAVQLRPRVWNWGILLLPVALFFGGLAVRMSDAIVIERQYRNERTWVENVSATYATFMNTEKIRNYKRWKAEEKARLAGNVWHEDYIYNPFLARFTTIKYDDNLLAGLDRYDTSAEDIILARTIDKLVAQLPGPLLRRIRPQLDKLEVNSYSMGDLMSSLQGDGILGRFLTGSLIAHCVATLGWLYPLALFALYFGIFTLYQVLATRTSGDHVSTITYTSLALAIPFQVFLSMNIEGWHSLASILVRNFWQLIILYGACCYFTGKVFVSKKRSGRRKRKFQPDDRFPREQPAALSHETAHRIE